MSQYGTEWFDGLLAQNPRWVRGTATPFTILASNGTKQSITFTTEAGFGKFPGINYTFPDDGNFVSWAQTGAILKDAPHPEGAKLLHNYMLTKEYQATMGWSVRSDVEPPKDFPWGAQPEDNTHTNPPAFFRFMQDRVAAERLRFWFENRIGTPQGKSPLEDDL